MNNISIVKDMAEFGEYRQVRQRKPHGLDLIGTIIPVSTVFRMKVVSHNLPHIQVLAVEKYISCSFCGEFQWVGEGQWAASSISFLERTLMACPNCEGRLHFFDVVLKTRFEDQVSGLLEDFIQRVSR